VVVQGGGSLETRACDYLHNRDMYIFADCAAKGADAEGGYYMLCLLRFVFLSPLLEFSEHFVLGCNHLAVDKTNSVIRSRLATVLCVCAWDYIFYGPN
jgi:hypothetical protein